MNHNRITAIIQGATFVYCTNSVAVCMEGAVYHLTHDSIDRPRHITPADAALIPWSSLDYFAVIEYGADPPPVAFMFSFKRSWRFHCDFHDSHTVRLVRSTHGSSHRRIRAARRAAAILSFAMGGHHRLGSASLVQLLDDNLARMVASFLLR